LAVDQARAFTQALMDRAGIPAANATQESIAAAKTQIGKLFSDLGSRNSLTVDDELRQELGNAVANYNRQVSLSQRAPGVEAAADDILTRNDPEIAGDIYTSMRSGFGKDAQRMRKSDPVQAQAYRDIQGALDNAMERSIAANNPDDLGAFREARRVYGNFQDISRAASKLTGENAVAGSIPPSRMQTVLSSGGKAENYAAGKGDLAELTRAGAGILQPMQAPSWSPDSLNFRRALTTALLNMSAGPTVRTPAAQAYLKNQLAAGTATSPAIAKISALAAALAGGAAVR
jgi:hypothetical protein